MKTFERRMAVTGLEVREGSDAFTLTGYASTFNQPYDMGWYTETVDPDAFKRTLGQKPDVRLLVNHDGLPLARTTSGTLTLSADKKGLLAEANLDRADPDVQALVPKMQRGDLNEMSFGFRVLEDIWENDMTKRTLRSLDLNGGDVSVVTYPANPNTSVSVRAGGRPIDAIASALRTMEARAATDEDMVSVLTRILGYFSAVDMIVDSAQDELADILEIPNPDVEEDADMTSEPGEAQANSAAVIHQFRKRLASAL